MAGAILCTVRSPKLQWTALNLEPDCHCAALIHLFQRCHSPVIRLPYLTARVGSKSAIYRLPLLFEALNVMLSFENCIEEVEDI